MSKGVYKRTEFHKSRILEGIITKRRSYRGENSPSYKGRVKNGDGYIRIFKPNHPYSTEQGYVMEHRLVVEKRLGRLLKPEEQVHHINKVKNDNHWENLIVFSSNSAHKMFETPMGRYNPNWKGGKPKCKFCNKEISYGRKYCKKHIPRKRNELGRFI